MLVNSVTQTVTICMSTADFAAKHFPLGADLDNFAHSAAKNVLTPQIAVSTTSAGPFDD